VLAALPAGNGNFQLPQPCTKVDICELLYDPHLLGLFSASIQN